MHNLLPYDGTIRYWGVVINDSKLTFQKLITEIDWKPDQANMFGKIIYTKREVAWHGDMPFRYRYSKINKFAQPWTPELLRLRNLVSQITGEYFNSCLLNLYHDGSEGMAWHSDAEKDLKKHGMIASVSLGAERKFSLKHKKTKKRIDVYLPTGSLLTMEKETQDHWLHRLPPSKKINDVRINLTFRCIKQEESTASENFLK